MATPLLRKIDCQILNADNLEAAVAFYSGMLGHSVIWRTEEAVAFRLPDTDAELVVNKRLGPETDFLVENVDAAFATLLRAGAIAVRPPFDIAIGRCAVLRDPFGNAITIVDQSKGLLVTDEMGNITGVRK